MKKTGSKKASVSRYPLPLSAMKHLVTVVVLAYCTMTIPMIPCTWAFLTTTIKTRNGYCRYCVSKTKEIFDERGDTESQLFPSEQLQSTRLDHSAESKRTETKRKSRIRSIRCENFAGMTNGRHGVPTEDENVIALSFDETEECSEQDGESVAILGGNLVCVTGETGSGKSLLVSKIADLLIGGKASATLIQGIRNTTSAKQTGGDEYPDTTPLSAASAEMELSLYDKIHLSFVSKTLHRMGLDPTAVLQESDEDGIENQQEDNSSFTLRLKRVISINPKSKQDGNNEEAPKRQRMKSACFINGHSVPLKVLKAIASPLIAIVNAPAAANALGRPALRLSMIDNGVPTSAIVWVDRLQSEYRKCKKYRESLERDLENQVLPASMIRRGIGDDGDLSSGVNDEQLELLRHWIEELDGFERRMSDLRDSLCSGSEASTNQIGEEELAFLLSDLNALDWSNEGDRNGETHTSSLYETLLDLHDNLKSLDARIIAAKEARESLASLSASDSARAALERTRQLLIDAAADSSNTSKSNGSVNSRVGISIERAHDMLNLVEDSLSECADFLDDDEKGLTATLEASRRSCPTSTEELLEYISEWSILARKHGVTPYQLPSCHNALKNELHGGIEAARLLPEAKIAEKKSLSELEEACRVLTEARSQVCQRVSDSISRRLPRLGMENSKFEARLRPIDNPSYSKSHLGVDEVDFYLLHEDMTTQNNGSNGARADRQIGGKIESVASSGEKARVLLAIECEVPGSISASSRESLVGDEQEQVLHILPVAVIYDEIDAHVGGRASVSVAQMLFDQSKACQILSITHSPSLAAIADTHICVHRGKSDTNGRMFDVVANRVEGVERRKELARMASGDMVMDEAEVFAEALLRDATSIKTQTT